MIVTALTSSLTFKANIHVRFPTLTVSRSSERLLKPSSRLMTIARAENCDSNKGWPQQAAPAPDSAAPAIGLSDVQQGVTSRGINRAMSDTDTMLDSAISKRLVRSDATSLQPPIRSGPHPAAQISDSPLNAAAAFA